MAEEAQGWVIDFTGWKMKDKRAFSAATNAGAQSGDDGVLYPFMAKAIKAWPHAGLDPTIPESYDELDMRDYREVTVKVAEAFHEYIDKGR